MTKKILLTGILLISMLTSLSAQKFIIKDVRVETGQNDKGEKAFIFYVSFINQGMPFVRMQLSIEDPKGVRAKDTNPEFKTIQLTEPFDLDEDGYYKDIPFVIEMSRFPPKEGKHTYWGRFSITENFEDRPNWIENEYFQFQITWPQKKKDDLYDLYDFLNILLDY